jgi:RNA polymerase sigma factor (sigma-70 family)
MGITDELVSAAQAGDADALRVIYRELSPVVVGYLTAKGVPDPEAVTGDVFITVLKRFDAITGGAAGVRTFVMSVAHARMVDDARSRRRRPALSPYLPETDARVSESAEHVALGAMATARLVAVLDQLPAAQREVVLLRVMADLSIEQVAQIVHRSPGAVKQLQRRGLLALRDLLDDPAEQSR